VDFAAREGLLAELPGLSVDQVWKRRPEGLPKLWLIRQALNCRRQHPGLFGAGSRYEPLPAKGPRAAHVVAFNRGNGLVTVVPRLVRRLASDWAATTLPLARGEWVNELTGDRAGGGDCRLADLLARFPVALLRRTEDAA
jgi:(1->4)-alpha-D-glucan 1-alpha-D-glucosylmutase